MTVTVHHVAKSLSDKGDSMIGAEREPDLAALGWQPLTDPADARATVDHLFRMLVHSAAVARGLHAGGRDLASEHGPCPTEAEAADSRRGFDEAVSRVVSGIAIVMEDVWALQHMFPEQGAAAQAASTAPPANASGSSVEYPATPTLDRMKAIRPETQAAGAFLEWLLDETPYVLAQYQDSDHDLPYQVHVTVEDLLARWKGIDLQAAENEKLAVLDMVRAANELHPPAHSQQS